jgi:hypothetical protein
VNRNIDIWRIELPLIVRQYCAGNPLLLATWVIVAGILREDEGLRPGWFRTVADIIAPLTQQLGLDGQPPLVAETLLGALVDFGLLTLHDGDYLTLPMLAMTELSIHEAQRLFAAAEGARTNPSPRPRQDTLPGFTG